MSSLDESTTRRLALIRYVYTVGISQSRQPEPMSAICVLTFQDSAELFLQLASEHLNTGASRPNFMEYWDLLSPQIGGGLTQKESMRRLNRARVAFKHHGTLPSKHDVELFRVTASNFFHDNTPTIFGIDFNTVSLLELVGCADTKSALVEAQKQRDAGDLEKALEHVALAFAHLVSDYENRKRSLYGESPFFFGEDMTFHSSFHMGIGTSSEISQFVDKTNESITAMQSAIKMLSLGLDYRRYVRFNLLTPLLRSVLSGDYMITRRHRVHELTEDDVQYCYDFVIESSLQLQEFDFTLQDKRSTPAT